MDIVRNWAMFLILVILLVFAFNGQNRAEPAKPSIPVCHAIQEDSDITDCEYHNGAWWTK